MPEHGSEPRGIKDSARATLDSGLDYARARAALLRVEAIEARSKLLRISRIGLAGLVFFIVGYSLLLYLGIRAAAEAWLDGRWQPALAAGAGAHLLLGLLLLLAARSRATRARLFASSLNQLDKDREWLRDLEETMKNRP